MNRRSGMTLIEVLLVTMIIIIIASVVVPRVVGAARQARESQLRAHLHFLREAVAVYHAHCGVYPVDLDDLIAWQQGEGSVDLGAGSLPGGYRGPYFTPSPTDHLPTDPMTGFCDWVYDRDTGWVRSAADKLAFDGTIYSSW